jgi:hypothetical protein
LRDVAQRSSPPGGPRRLTPDMLDDLKKASDEQVARLNGAHEEAEKEIMATLDQMDQMQELINDFNLFKSLYQAQQDLAAQSRAYDRPGQLSREDQLALKELASTEKEVADSLGRLRDKLRDDAATAEKLFPKAARSGRDLAEQIGQRRLEPLAQQATGQMLAGSGDQSSELAARLSDEMEKMFSQCQSGNCPSSGELDSYLQLQHLNPNNNFAQMSRSRKFGDSLGRGRASGQGEGAMGTSGYAMTDGSNLQVLGNESKPRNGNRTSRQPGRLGQGAGVLAGNGNDETAKPDAIKNLNPVNRQSGAVSSETVIEAYNDVVENYFKAITTKKEKPADEMQN